MTLLLPLVVDVCLVPFVDDAVGVTSVFGAGVSAAVSVGLLGL